MVYIHFKFFFCEKKKNQQVSSYHRRHGAALTEREREREREKEREKNSNLATLSLPFTFAFTLTCFLPMYTCIYVCMCLCVCKTRIYMMWCLLTSSRARLGTSAPCEMRAASTCVSLPWTLSGLGWMLTLYVLIYFLAWLGPDMCRFRRRSGIHACMHA